MGVLIVMYMVFFVQLVAADFGGPVLQVSRVRANERLGGGCEKSLAELQNGKITTRLISSINILFPDGNGGKSLAVRGFKHIPAARVTEFTQLAQQLMSFLQTGEQKGSIILYFACLGEQYWTQQWVDTFSAYGNFVDLQNGMLCHYGAKRAKRRKYRRTIKFI